MRTKCAYVSLPENLRSLLYYSQIVDEVTGLLETGVLLITEKDGQIRQLNRVLRLMREEKVEVVYVYFGVSSKEEKLRLFSETVQELQAKPTASVS